MDGVGCPEPGGWSYVKGHRAFTEILQKAMCINSDI